VVVQDDGLHRNVVDEELEAQPAVPAGPLSHVEASGDAHLAVGHDDQDQRNLPRLDH
jgi:hypothetical protein